MKFSELIYEKHLEQHLAHSKRSIRVTIITAIVQHSIFAFLSLFLIHENLGIHCNKSGL